MGKVKYVFLWGIMFLCVGCVLLKVYGVQIKEEKKEFIKENGVWIIEDGRQLALLSSMVANGIEIEPGIIAAEASYLLVKDIKVQDWLRIGSLKSPFCGRLDGNGYSITGVGFFITTTEDAKLENLEICDREYGNKEIIIDEKNQNWIEEITIIEEKNPLFIKQEKIGTLDVLNYVVSKEEQFEYHIVLKGEWEEEKIVKQEKVFLESKQYPLNKNNYFVTQVDINYDNKADLLVHKADSSGSGGRWHNFTAFIWNKETKEFVIYPSFPAQLTFLEFNEGRMISRGRIGLENRFIQVYEYYAEDGEYCLAKELIWTSIITKEGQKKKLSYYEKGELMESIDVTEMEEWQIEKLFPEIAYWEKG